MKQKEINKVEIRNLQKEDYDQLASSFTRVYADGSDVFWTLNKSTNSFAYSPKDKSSRLSMIKSWAVPSLSS